MTRDDIAILVRTRMLQAKECLEDANCLYSLNRGARSIINRTYYAAFYAVLAVLQTQENLPRKHTGVISLFDVEFVKKGLISKNLSQTLHWLFEERQQHDYQTLHPSTMEDAREALQAAGDFVQSIESFLNSQGYKR